MSFTPPPAKPVSPGLYLVATPIGNLRDITLRALDVLAAADVVLAEDTRVTGKLLSAYGLSKKLVRYDEHVAAQAGPRILEDLAAGKVVAQVSDAGTPLISDPGQALAREAAEAGFPVHPIPGASSVLAALSIAGLPTERFLFTGFLPPKSGARRARLDELATSRATLVLFETGPRLRASLEDMAEVLGADRPAAVARELTKLHEECVRAPLAALAADPRLEAPKGEIVVVVGPGREAAATEDEAEAALRQALKSAGPAEAASEVARALGLNRRDLYRRAVAIRGEEA
ncbi:16S rRNA (cytidine(1402)-2'-O)-methyltransferase [Brevundimonas sp.]|uniref:16S rRNA (cytidine(1402)-2'-O)-methyltransferase n=1 Tax=Brevundimonas sp. TaxID=1871086 RepID=UPI0025D966B8|nr:16S rRNA (cytidine(1402)-2'-O)-methyltransferase [Brevundimonas sp.]